MRRRSPGGQQAGRPAFPGGPLVGAIAACLAATLAAAAGFPRPGSSQNGPGPIGGPQLASTSVIVNYPAVGAKPLPDVDASAFVLAVVHADVVGGDPILDAGEGHDGYRSG